MKRRQQQKTDGDDVRPNEFTDEDRDRVHESVSRLLASQRTLVVVAVEDERSVQ